MGSSVCHGGGEGDERFLTRAGSSTAPPGQPERSQLTPDGHAGPQPRPFHGDDPFHRVPRRGLTVQQGGEGAGEQRGLGRGRMGEAGRRGVGKAQRPVLWRRRGARLGKGRPTVHLGALSLSGETREKNVCRTDGTRGATKRGRGFHSESLQRPLVRHQLGPSLLFREHFLKHVNTFNTTVR